jgi:hypothetical protein
MRDIQKIRGYIEGMVGVKSDRPNMQVIRQTLNVG